MRILRGKKFEAQFLNKLSDRQTKYPLSIQSSVEKIVNNVRRIGDKALLGYTQEIDNVTLDPNELKVSSKEINESYDKITQTQLRAIKVASKNIERFHKIQRNKMDFKSVINGASLGQIVRPITSVGIYSPGGRNPYPSSILMCAIPAKIAGVKNIMACTPPRNEGKVDPAILVAANIAGVKHIYKVGGAQAIAAMAYGTESITAVDKIVGPGNIYVTAAKSYVNRDVAIDFPAGPTELVIIADEFANSRFIVSDMLAQAEHDTNSLVILFTSSKKVADDVKTNISEQKSILSRKEIVTEALNKNGFIVIVKNLEEAISLANKLAPEHLEILTQKPYQLLGKVENAGAVFLGEYSPVALGDYTIGTNHVLPTGGWARIYSGLSIRDFVKTINFVDCSSKELEKLAEDTITMAELEGLEGHAKSISIRRKKYETK